MRKIGMIGCVVSAAIFMLVSGVLFVGCLGIVFSAEKDAAQRDRQHETMLKTRPGETVTARQLFREFQHNEVSAHTRYDGHRVEIDGIVQKVAVTDEVGPLFNTEFHRADVQLRTGNQFMPVHAIFNDFASVRNLDRGDRITFWCTVNGQNMFGEVGLNDCVWPTN